jgi:flagellar protein FliS
MSDFIPYHRTNVYSTIGLETEVLSATPHGLIGILLDHGSKAIMLAKGHVERGETAAKGERISKALAIIGELTASLNVDVGGELAGNLASLYDYMTIRLVKANLENDPAGLDEVRRLLLELKTAWDAIKPPSAVDHEQKADATPAADDVRSRVA